MRAAIVCNSINPDLVQYFKVISESEQSKDFLVMTAQSNGIQKAVVSTTASSSFLSLKFLADLFRIPSLARKLSKAKCKYVHFTTAHLLNIPQALVFKLFGPKLIFTIHDLEPHPGFKSKFVSLYNALVLRITTHIVVHNQRYLKEIGEKAFYVPLSGFSHHDVEKSLTKELLFFGRIEEYKGLGNLLDLAKKMEKHAPDWTLKVVGKGKSIHIDALQELDNTTVRNEFIKEDELNDLIRQSSYTILPYDSATQSGVIIKSFSVNTPVIGYHVGAFGEYVDEGKTGYLVAHKNNDSIIRILNSIKADDYSGQIEYVRNTFILTYSDQSYLDYMLAFYDGLNIN